MSHWKCSCCLCLRRSLWMNLLWQHHSSVCVPCPQLFQPWSLSKTFSLCIRKIHLSNSNFLLITNVISVVYHITITPCAGSAISAVYASRALLVRWLGPYSSAQQDLVNLAGVWAPGQDMSNPDSWKALILTFLKCAHALLLEDYECKESGPSAGPASSDAPLAIAGPADTQNPTAGGSGPSKPPPALPSLKITNHYFLYKVMHVTFCVC